MLVALEIRRRNFKVQIRDEMHHLSSIQLFPLQYFLHRWPFTPEPSSIFF